MSQIVGKIQDLEVLKDGIVRARRVLVDGIREYVKAQLRQWQRVPYLALEADGRGCAEQPQYEYAYNNGFWAIYEHPGSERVTAYMLYVDCATGELLDPSRTHMDQQPVAASDDQVANLINRLDLLDATRVVARLEKAARTPVVGLAAGLDPRGVDDWRARTRKSLGLGRLYEAPQRGPIKRYAFGD